MPAPNARFQIQLEREIPRGWTYRVQMLHPDRSVTLHDVSLSWSDHDYWSGGRLPPSTVVEQVLNHLTDAQPALVLPPKFDLARVRRWSPEIDLELRPRLFGSAA